MGTSGTQFTADPSMMTDNDTEMKDFDFSRMKGHDHIEIAEVNLSPTSFSEHESPSPV
jgi:hypothetical protein